MDFCLTDFLSRIASLLRGFCVFPAGLLAVRRAAVSSPIRRASISNSQPGRRPIDL